MRVSGVAEDSRAPHWAKSHSSDLRGDECQVQSGVPLVEVPSHLTSPEAWSHCGAGGGGGSGQVGLVYLTSNVKNEDFKWRPKIQRPFNSTREALLAVTSVFQ